MTRIKLGLLATVLFFSVFGHASAAIIPIRTIDPYFDPGKIGATWAAYEGSGFVTTFDPQINLFTLSSSFGTVGGNAWLLPFGAQVFFVDDIVGFFSMSVEFSESGVVKGGAFSWLVGSPSLGLAPNTLVMSGTTVFAQLSLQQTGFDFFANIDFLHPTLRQAIGPVKTLLAKTLADACFAAFAYDPPGTLCGGSSAMSGPDLYFSPRKFKVPEPNSVALIVIGLLGIRFLSRLRGST